MRTLALPFLIGACTPASAGGDTVVDGRHVDEAGHTGPWRMVVPAGVGEGHGVLLFFTWDGAGRAYRRQASRRASIAAEHDLAIVAMPPPDGQRCWWAPTVEENARFVEDFVRDELVGRRGVDPDRVFLSGLSGGADFAAAFPYHAGFAYGAGVVALCGGDVPRLDGGDCATEADPPAAPPRAVPERVREALRFAFALTADDPLLAHARAAAAVWRDAGLTHVRDDVVPGAGHCGFADGFLGGTAELRAGLDYVDPRTR